MLFLDLQAELVRSWMQLAESGTKSMTAAIQGAAEAVQPKPEPVSPFAAMFTAANPFLAHNPFFAHNPFVAMAASPQAGWPMTAFMTQPATPLSSFLPSPSFLPGMWNPMSWSSLFAPQMFAPSLFAPGLFGAGLFGANLSGNPWSAFFGAGNNWAQNAWSGNPWASLWQMPASQPQPSISSFVDAWTASYRIATEHATEALLTPFKQPAASENTGWTWPMGGSGRVH